MSGRWKEAAGVGLYWLAARQLSRLRTREQISRHQQRRWQVMSERLGRMSPFYAAFRGLPLAQWPQMDKACWMQHFDTINSAGITLEQAFGMATKAETTRDFRPRLGRVSVGLSTGTSGARGVFLASDDERWRWSATMLAKLLPRGVFARERVVLLLRAGSNLYDTLGSSRLQFRYIDLLQPFDEVLRQLREAAPTILVGPAQALALVARSAAVSGMPAPRRVISVAEVLDPLDRQCIEQAWPLRVEQIYQATEGYLGQTCVHGTVHLNEDCLIIERDWVDRSRRRFVPIITDLYRHTQPVVRYRLNDVLVEADGACPCGSAHLAIEYIEGREDDVMWWPGVGGGRVPVFADSLTRALLNADPAIADYQLEQLDDCTLGIATEPPVDARRRQQIEDALQVFFRRLQVVMPRLQHIDMPARDLGRKRRRVRGRVPAERSGHA